MRTAIDQDRELDRKTDASGAAVTDTLRATMTTTIAAFLARVGTDRQDWTTPQDGAETLVSLVEALLVGDRVERAFQTSHFATLSLLQLQRSGDRVPASHTSASLPGWANCMNDHCRTMQRCSAGRGNDGGICENTAIGRMRRSDV